MTNWPNISSIWTQILLCVLIVAVTGGAFSADVARGQSPDASTYTLVLRDVPLRQALEELVSATQINLVYDSELVSDQRIYCSGKNLPPEALLQCILSDAGLDYIRTSAGTYVLVDSARQAPRYGQLAGRVVDDETGEPLPNAHVLLADASTGTTTNDAGLFTFSSLLSGPHRIVVTYMGYRTHVDRVWIPPNDGVRKRIALHPDPVTEEPIIVTGLQQRLPSEGLGRDEFTASRVNLMGQLGTSDVARGAGTLMGVSRQSPLAELHIQGGSTGEHQVQLDGIPIRNPVSLGRLLGAFSPLAIGRFTVHKAGFEADHGSHIAGLIDIEHDLRRSGDRYATFKADPVSMNGRIQQSLQLPSGIEGDVMIAGRTSMWNVYRDPALNELLTEWNTADPLLASELLGREVRASDLHPFQSQIGVSFSDVHAATRLELDPFRILYASAYRGTNEIGADFRSGWDASGDSTRSVATRDRYDWTNQGAQMRLEWLMGARTSATLRLHGSQHVSRYEYYPEPSGDADAPSDNSADDAPPIPDENNRVDEIGAEAELNYSISSRHRITGALEAMRMASQFQSANGFIDPLAYENATWHLASHLNGEWTLGLNTTLEGGTRLTFVPERQTAYAEPRLALRYDRSESALGGYSVRVAGGLYRQFTNRFDLSSTGPTSAVPSIRFWLPIDQSVAPPKAYHASADVLLMPAPSWTISTEAYYKAQPRILSIDYPTLLGEPSSETPRPITQGDFITASRGYAYGGSVRLKYEGNRLQSTLSYSLSQSQRRFPSRFDDRMEPTPWNEPHRLALDTDVSITGGLRAHLSWKGIWGRSWAFRRAYYDYLTSTNRSEALASFNLDDPSAQTLPPLYRLDAGLSYTHRWKGVRVEAQTHLMNVLDRPNEFDWNLSPTDSGLAKGVRTLPGRRPVFSLTIGY